MKDTKMKQLKIQIISLFPKMFEGVLSSSMLWKAQEKDLVSFNHIDLREFGLGTRKRVDDTPYGGGDGMLLMPEPLFAAIEYAKTIDNDSTVFLMTPKGRKLDQAMARDISSKRHGMIIVCGHYEGYDERITTIVDECVSIGDFILTGGELPAMVLIDSVVRLLPGVLGGATSASIESFSQESVLEFPQYTRPENFRGLVVPDVLLSGNHAQIEAWRQAHSLVVSSQMYTKKVTKRRAVND
jgi:tRNA (guanine37-N1)-methyltransferase